MGSSDEEPEEEVEVEYSISMHCNACERKVAKIISKIKGLKLSSIKSCNVCEGIDEGVEKFMTDMNNNRVVVTGRFKPEKVLKKLKKKTRKRVEIVIPEEGEGEGEDENGEDDGDLMNVNDEEPLALMHEMEEAEWGDEIPVLTMFSDENANACSIM